MPPKLKVKATSQFAKAFRPAKKTLNVKIVRFPRKSILHTQTIALSKNGKLTIEAMRNPGGTHSFEGLPAANSKEEVGNFTCDVYSFKGVLETHDGIMNRPALENIYPGAIYPFESIADGTFNDVDFRRKPIQLTTNNNFFKKKLIEVKTVNRGQVQQAIADMKGSAKPKDADATKSSTEKIYSSEQLFMSTSGSGHYLTIGGNHQIDYESEKKTHKYFVQFYQEYYTVAVNDDSFGELEDYFVTKKEAPTDKHAIDDGAINPNWVMIDSVTYGRMFHLIFESSEDIEAHGIDINVFAEFGLFGGEGGFTERQREVLSKVTVASGAIGGDIKETALLGNAESVKDLKARKDNYFKNPGEGSIIGYTLRTLDGDLVGYRMSTDFTARQCAPKASKYKITWQQIQCMVNDDSDSTEDIKAFCRIRAFNGKGKEIMDEQRKNAPLLDWEKLDNAVKQLTPRPWTFTIGSVQNPIELSEGALEKVDKSITFNIPKNDDNARLAIRADLIEIDDTSGNDDFGDKLWERRVSELSGGENVELTCHHEDSRIRFSLKVQPVFD